MPPTVSPPFHPKKLHSRKVWFVIDAFLGILVVALAWHIYVYRNDPKDLLNFKYGFSSVFKNEPKALVYSPKHNTVAPKATNSTPSISIDYITIPTGVIENDNSNGDSASTAMGHYVYIDTSVSVYNKDTQAGGKLIYDGHTITENAYLVTASQVISQNGLHYAYVQDDGTNFEIYIDGKMVNNSLSDQDSLQLIGVSNNGKDFLYTYTDDNGNDIIAKDGSNEYTAQGIINVYAANADLSSWIADDSSTDLSGNNAADSVILNGKVINTTTSSVNYVGMSESGQHYYFVFTTPSSTGSTGNTNPSTPIYNNGKLQSYSSPIHIPTAILAQATSGPNIPVPSDLSSSGGPSPGTLYVDNNKITSASDLTLVGINDAGDYYYLNVVSHVFNIDSKYSYTLPSIDFGSSENNNLYASINSDISHYAIGNSGTQYWDIDGQKMDVNGDVYQVELEGDTLFVYNWSN